MRGLIKHLGESGSPADHPNRDITIRDSVGVHDTATVERKENDLTGCTYTDERQLPMNCMGKNVLPSSARRPPIVRRSWDGIRPRAVALVSSWVPGLVFGASLP